MTSLDVNSKFKQRNSPQVICRAYTMYKTRWAAVSASGIIWFLQHPLHHLPLNMWFGINLHCPVGFLQYVTVLRTTAHFGSLRAASECFGLEFILVPIEVGRVGNFTAVFGEYRPLFSIDWFLLIRVLALLMCFLTYEHARTKTFLVLWDPAHWMRVSRVFKSIKNTRRSITKVFVSKEQARVPYVFFCGMEP